MLTERTNCGNRPIPQDMIADEASVYSVWARKAGSFDIRSSPKTIIIP